MPNTAPSKVLAATGTADTVTEVAPITTSAGAPNAYQLVQTGPDGFLDRTLLASVPAVQRPASEALAAGALFNQYDSGAGVIKIRNASNTGVSTRAHGVTLAAIAANASGPVQYGNSVVTGLSGLTPGATYVLGTGGAPALAAPTASGTIIQGVGTANSATELAVILGPVTIRS
jgi:hypothetical protein